MFEWEEGAGRLFWGQVGDLKSEILVVHGFEWGFAASNKNN